MEYFRGRFISELNEEGDIEIRGFRWSRYEILETMDRAGANELFLDWVDGIKLQCKQRATEFLEKYGCLDRFKALCNRVRKRNVMPFVGAGMSIASGFKPWGEFLISLLSDAPSAQGHVSALVVEQRFEEAAQLVEDTLGADVFFEELESKCGRDDYQVKGPVRLLPHLFYDGVLTTNFDQVLPICYREEGREFHEVYYGDELDVACRELGDQPHCLIKLHGDARRRQGRVLTVRDYEANYGSGTLSGFLERIVGTRSLLFLGCSLCTDRTFLALKEIKERSIGEPVRHYAFLPFPGADQRHSRRQQLAQAEIHPIYYPPEEHDQAIEDLLITMLEGGRND